MNLPEIRQWKPQWLWEDGSIDFADIKDGPVGWAISGRHDKTSYEMMWNTDVTCKWLHVVNVDHDGRKKLHLTRTSEGWQHKDGTIATGSANAMFPDLAWTAMTNTLPIRNLMASGQTHAAFDVLFVSAPDLVTTVVRQSYRRLEDGWQYKNHANGFSAVLTVDNDGLVTDYPGVCTRIKDLKL